MDNVAVFAARTTLGVSVSKMGNTNNKLIIAAEDPIFFNEYFIFLLV